MSVFVVAYCSGSHFSSQLKKVQVFFISIDKHMMREMFENNGSAAGSFHLCFERRI